MKTIKRLFIYITNIKNNHNKYFLDKNYKLNYSL